VGSSGQRLTSKGEIDNKVVSALDANVHAQKAKNDKV
jgi:hypothetical protein